MSEIKTFFRFCPECGRRFHIKVLSKNLVSLQREKEQVEETAAMLSVSRYPVSGTPALLLQEGEPVTVDVEEFQYVYKCKHCGHEWSEKHIEEHKE